VIGLVLLRSGEDVGTTGLIGHSPGIAGLIECFSILGVSLFLLLEGFGFGRNLLIFLLGLNFGGH
jgi:hypothetical protein